MEIFNIPTRNAVSDENKANFDRISSLLGMMPNLYATFAHSGSALTNYMTLQAGKSSIFGQAREVVNLVVSEANGCRYCLAAHTTVAKALGFTDDQMAEIRSGYASFDPKLNALAQFSALIVRERGHVSDDAVRAFLAADWTKENVVDVIMLIGEKTISNYLHSATKIAIDFPIAPALTK